MNDAFLQKGIQNYAKASQNDSPLRKAIALYDKVIENLKLAKKAIEETNIGDKYKYIKEAETLITKLNLAMDRSVENEMVKIFEALYTNFIISINSIIILDKPAEDLEIVIRDIEKIKEELIKVDAWKPGAENQQPASGEHDQKQNNLSNSNSSNSTTNTSSEQKDKKRTINFENIKC